ncbi:MAG: IS21-like element helper ATPase IstB [Lentisphaerota bacterium]
MKNDYTKLLENLNNLRLTFIAENFKQSAVHAAAKNLDHTAYLEGLIEGETALKHEISIKNKIKNARLPYTKTLEQYNWNHPIKINRMQIENIFRLDFIEQKKNIIFLGGCGVGKTHLSIAIAERACSKGFSVLFTPAIDIINNLSGAASENTLDKAIRKYTLPKLLVIDELGYLPIDKLGANLLFQIISKRYETGSILLTGNRAFKEWPKIFDNDSTVTSAVLDRLLHHSEVVIIEGKSYRMKDKTEN